MTDDRMDRFIVVHDRYGSPMLLNVRHIMEIDVMGSATTSPVTRIHTSLGATRTPKESVEEVAKMLDVCIDKGVRKKALKKVVGKR